MSSGVVLISGGTRSGKSTFAQDLASALGGSVVYIATAEARDNEMSDRIAIHRASRPAEWETIEAPLELPEAILSCGDKADVIIVDCLTVFMSNVLMEALGDLGDTDDFNIDPSVQTLLLHKVDQVVNAACQVKAKVLFVSNEVGQGLVPPYKLGRFFRDMAGFANQKVARAADRVFSVNCGIAIELKAIASSPVDAARQLATL